MKFFVCRENGKQKPSVRSIMMLSWVCWGDVERGREAVFFGGGGGGVDGWVARSLL